MKKNILILTLASLVVGTQVQAADAQSSVTRLVVPTVITAGAAYMLYNWYNKPAVQKQKPALPQKPIAFVMDLKTTLHRRNNEQRKNNS